MILRFDDTNPDKCRQAHCDGIVEALSWLGYDVSSMLVTYTSQYFEELLGFARRLVREGKAFVCHEASLSGPSPSRDRTVEENLAAFERMVRGEGREGGAVLRLRYQDANFCDPVAYRAKTAPHFREGRRWHVYPSYDFSHPAVDALEDIAVSICTAEFKHHRALYEWVQGQLGLPPVPQREQPRLNLEDGVVLSKRTLTGLVGVHIEDFGDPRLATIAGLRTRGVPVAVVHAFVEKGLRVFSQLIDLTRKALLPVAPSFNVVLDPLRCHASSPLPSEGGEGGGVPATFLVSRHDFEEREAPQGEASDAPLSLSRQAGLFGVDAKLRVEAIRGRRDDGSASSLEVVLFRGERIQGVRSVPWVADGLEMTLVYPDHVFLDDGPSPRPTPLWVAKGVVDQRVRGALKTGRSFVHSQTFRAPGLGYLTLAEGSAEDDLVFYVTAFLRNKQQKWRRCFQQR